MLIRDRERYRLDRTKIDIDIDELDRLLAVTGDADQERDAPETCSPYGADNRSRVAPTPWAEGAIHQLHATLLDLLGRIGVGKSRITA